LNPKDSLQKLIFGLIYGEPIPDGECGLYTNRGTELHWLIPVKPVEPISAQYKRIALDHGKWIRCGERSPELRYAEKMRFSYSEDFETVHGWWLADSDGDVFFCQRFTESEEVKNTWLERNEIEFEIRLFI